MRALRHTPSALCAGALLPRAPSAARRNHRVFTATSRPHLYPHQQPTRRCASPRHVSRSRHGTITISSHITFSAGFRASFEDHARARAGTVHGGSLLGPSVSTMSLGQSIKPTMRIALPNVHAHLHPPGPAHPLHHALSVPAGGQASARHSAHDK